MPIPSPRKGEKESKFIGRCMGDGTMKSEYPKNPQRLAVCYSSWRKVRGGKPPPKGEKLMVAVKTVVERIRSYLKWSARAKSLTKESMYHIGALSVVEVFFSLRDALDAAVRQEFGTRSWVVDFSNKEVIVHTPPSATVPGMAYDVEGEPKHQKVSYKVVKGDVEFTSTPEDVTRKVSYESQLKAADMVDLVEMEMEIKRKKE